MLLTKEQILEKRLKMERIEVSPGCEINVRALPVHVTERASKIDSPKFGADAYIFVNAVVSENGERLYGDDYAEVVAQNVDTGLVQLVVSKAYALSRVDPATIEQIKKNWNRLDIEPSGESPSA